MFKNLRNAAFLFYPPIFFPVRKSAMGRKIERKKMPERLERGGPLLTVETEVNGDSKNTFKLKWSFLGWCTGLNVPVQEIFCPALTAQVGPVQNIFFLTIHYFNYLSPSACKLHCKL